MPIRYGMRLKTLKRGAKIRSSARAAVAGELHDWWGRGGGVASTISFVVQDGFDMMVTRVSRLPTVNTVESEGEQNH